MRVGASAWPCRMQWRCWHRGWCRRSAHPASRCEGCQGGMAGVVDRRSVSGEGGGERRGVEGAGDRNVGRGGGKETAECRGLKPLRPAAGLCTKERTKEHTPVLTHSFLPCPALPPGPAYGWEAHPHMTSLPLRSLLYLCKPCHPLPPPSLGAHGPGQRAAGTCRCPRRRRPHAHTRPPPATGRPFPGGRRGGHGRDFRCGLAPEPAGAGRLGQEDQGQGGRLPDGCGALGVRQDRVPVRLGADAGEEGCTTSCKL